jgi:hypothetical protein
MPVCRGFVCSGDVQKMLLFESSPHEADPTGARRWQYRAYSNREIAARYDGFDAILAPTLPIEAPPS